MAETDRQTDSQLEGQGGTGVSRSQNEKGQMFILDAPQRRNVVLVSVGGESIDSSSSTKFFRKNSPPRFRFLSVVAAAPAPRTNNKRLDAIQVFRRCYVDNMFRILNNVDERAVLRGITKRRHLNARRGGFSLLKRASEHRDPCCSLDVIMTSLHSRHVPVFPRNLSPLAFSLSFSAPFRPSIFILLPIR